jgi:hypothetical protein
MRRADLQHPLAAPCLAAALLGTAGCSALFLHGAPSGGGREVGIGVPPVSPSCTQSRLAPVADSLLAAAAATFGAAALQAALTCSPNCAENAGPGLAVISGGVVIGATLSAIHGFNETSRCRDAWSAWCASHDCAGRSSPAR